MGFKRDEFDAARFEARTKQVRLPDLAAWFDGEPVWTVRGLDGTELARVNASEGTAEKLQAVVAALSGAGQVSDKAEAIKSLLGVANDAPGEYVRRLEILCLGSVDPVCDRPMALRLAKHRPVEFYQLTNEINVLTGQGSAVAGESSGSGATPASGSPSPSGTSTDGSSTSPDPTCSPTGG